MTEREYIWRCVPGAPPTHRETRAIIAWCDEWARDTFGVGVRHVNDAAGVEALTPLQLLRGCETHLEGGLSSVVADVRRCGDA